MIQTIYKIIYQEKINLVLRNLNKFLKPILPKRIQIPPSGVLEVKIPGGRNVLKLKTNQTSYFTQLFFWEGGIQQFEYTDIFLQLIKEINIFYDIGANIGFYSLIAAIENKNMKIVSFEPASGPLYYFRENVRLNNCDNIKVEPIALSNKEGKIDFYEVRNIKYTYLKHNLSGESNAGSNKNVKNLILHDVTSSTLDNYVREHHEETIDLIKMDTEGTEHLILEQSKYILQHMKPIIICETLFNTIENELEEIMLEFGYEFFNHIPEGLKQVSTIKRNEDNCVRNCFFVHPVKKDLIKKFIV